MKLSEADFSSPISEALYALGITPNQMSFWVMLVAAKLILENPLLLTAIRGQLFPAIEDTLNISTSAIDSLLRRTAARVMKSKSCAALRAYSPYNDGRTPCVGVFLSMWAHMAADAVEADRQQQAM